MKGITKAWISGIFFFLMASLAMGQADYALQRSQMVKTQIQARGITHQATLSAMLNVPRHEFVPEDKQVFAYSDGPLPIGNGQTISQPYIVGYMTQALRLKASHRVLEIGTGSGYQAAVLSKIADSVYTIEIVKELAITAKKRLKLLGYDNAIVRQGDGYHGWPEKAPFDAIMVTAGAEAIPQPLLDQLKVGGRMIIPVGPHNAVRQLVLVTKKKDKIIKKNVMPVRFVPFTRDKTKNKS
ncbi:protein-L-isoaspartate(D-aspartate) O-methyltransferase [Flagellimonas allohymeniacidonis]|uniref:Protein-L-isoaspartate O-methyltransferase n=1 Tax=Flagellimonas allohymeniacidonis TaxID=2517819 RepID=A0A4Q8QHS2_9FLAO|nr:protein-L-isoaspartate(D-aspartate) O-methyltransferase [Allomuricauda hymeniacidonis]TAI48838.1 protein-L-isoaspartate(D-aspartate) O-methyltransferase [Allomuricauda hymeniacidonis]